MFVLTRGGLFKSSDGGENWTFVQTPEGYSHQVFEHRGRIYVEVGYDLYVSSGEGGSWRKMPAIGERQEGEHGRYYSIDGKIILSLRSADLYQFDEGENKWNRTFESDSGWLDRPPEIVATNNYLLTNRGSDIYRSADGGQNWQKLNSLPTSGRNSYRPVDSLFKAGSTVFAIVPQEGFRGIYYSVPGKPVDDQRVLYASTDSGTSWRAVDFPRPPSQIASAISMGEIIFVGTSTGLLRSDNQGTSWEVVRGPEESITALEVLHNNLFIGTSSQLYKSDSAAQTWKPASDGISSTVVTTMVAFGEYVFAVAEGGQLYRTSNSGETWEPVLSGGFIATDRVAFNDETHTLFVSGPDDSILKSRDFGVTWETLPFQVAGGKLKGSPRKGFSLHSRQGSVFAAKDDDLYQSVDNGETWRPIGSPHPEREYRWGAFVNVSAADEGLNAVFFSDTDNLYQFSFIDNSWSAIGPKLGAQIGAASVSSNMVVVASFGSADDLIINLFRMRLNNPGAWERLKADGLAGQMAHRNGAIWIDPDSPNVIFIVTSHGMFASSDGGEQFRKLELGEMSDGNSYYNTLVRRDGHFLLGTSRGVFYVEDRIPRHPLFPKAVEVLGQHWTSALTISAAFLFVLVFSTRIILVALQQEIYPVTVFAPLLYLTRFGRWKLYRSYRKRLTSNREARDLETRFIDPPFSSSDSQIQDQKSVIEALRTLPPSLRVVVLAKGGGGKSTISRKFAWSAAKGNTVFSSTHLIPVLIEGLNYSGDLEQAITNSLRNERTYINETIVRSQLLAGRLLIILDGLNEIRDSVLLSDKMADLPNFLQKYPDTPFIVTSRGSLAPSIGNVLKNAITVQLDDFDRPTQLKFFSKYLKRAADADSVMDEVDLRFPDLPRIPLLLRLIAVIYDRTGSIPNDKLNLFSDFVQQLLRSEVTGIDEAAGLQFAIRHLARETFLEAGGERGFTIEKAEEALSSIRERLANYDINLSPIKLLNVLVRAGVYRRTGDTLKCFHDSFESYFAARALESDFRNNRTALFVKLSPSQRLIETFEFLTAMLLETGDLARFEAFRAGLARDL